MFYEKDNQNDETIVGGVPYAFTSVFVHHGECFLESEARGCHREPFGQSVNLDIAKGFNEKNDVFTSAGNHEYIVYIWNDGDNYERRDRVRDSVKLCFTNDIEFSVRIEHGVKFISSDAKISFLNPCVRISLHICSMGFISGV